MARYRDAVQWLANNEDQDLGDPDEGGYLVTIHFAADLFGKEAGQVYADVRRRRDLDQRAHERMIRAEEEEEDRMMDDNPRYKGLL